METEAETNKEQSNRGLVRAESKATDWEIKGYQMRLERQVITHSFWKVCRKPFRPCLQSTKGCQAGGCSNDGGSGWGGNDWGWLMYATRRLCFDEGEVEETWAQNSTIKMGAVPSVGRRWWTQTCTHLWGEIDGRVLETSSHGGLLLRLRPELWKAVRGQGFSRLVGNQTLRIP